MLAFPDLTLPDVLLVLGYLAVLWLPGGLVGAVAGLRGWPLAAGAPLLTYGVAGLAGPWLHLVGIDWSPAAFAIVVAGVAVAAGLVRSRLGPSRPGTRAAPVVGSRGWSTPEHLGVAGTVLLAAGVGALAVWVGIRRLATVPQGFDAVFHAAGVRWIAETGDGGLTGTTQVNWYDLPADLFYPNGYHLAASLVYELSGRGVPTVLNAHTVLIPGLLALSTAALLHRLAARPTLVAGTALVLVATSAHYDLLWNVLLPYAAGLALTPVALVFLLDLLDSRSAREAVLPGVLLALGVAGLLSLHPGVPFGMVVFALPLLAWRWWRSPRSLRREPLLLVVAAVATAVVCGPHVLGSLKSAAGTPTFDWPAVVPPSEAVGDLLTFGHKEAFPQWWLAVALVAGLLTYRRLGELRWIGLVAACFGGLFVLAASYDTELVGAVTRPWWNDRFRLISLAAIPLAVIAGHGLAELTRGVAALLRGAADRFTAPSPLRSAAAALAAVVVLGGFVLASDGLYLARNEAKMRMNILGGPAISKLEMEGMRALAELVPPGVRVLNDRADGSVWAYPLNGTRTVAGHYVVAPVSPDVRLLEQRFNDYDTDPAVRAAAERLNVGFVVVHRGFLLPWGARQPGLTNLEGVQSLARVFGNEDVIIYRLFPPTGS